MSIFVAFFTFSVSKILTTKGSKNRELNDIMDMLNSAGKMKKADMKPIAIMKAAINMALEGLFFISSGSRNFKIMLEFIYLSWFGKDK